MVTRFHQLLTAALFLVAALPYPGCGAPASESAQKPASADKPRNDDSVDLSEESSATIVTNENPLPYPPEKMEGPSLDECNADHVGAGFMAVSFKGTLVWKDMSYPSELPKATSLTIEVQDATRDEMEDRPILFVYHTKTSSAYEPGKPLPYAFCAKIPDNKNITEYGLHTHLNLGRVHVESGGSRVESYIGLTEVESGIDEYGNVRVRMFPVVTTEQTVEDGRSSDGAPASKKPGQSKYDASCNFASVKDEGIIGVATEVSVSFPSELDAANLPKPTYLTVRMDDISTDEDEPQAVAVFTSDITAWYKQGAPLTALLCAKLPDHGESIMYRVIALLNVGWDGYTKEGEEAAGTKQEKDSEKSSEESAEDDDFVQTLRKGDFVGTTMVVVLPGKVDYTASTDLEPYKSTE
ncbi:conserved hypothetical protein [Neospora caninum Liverpool]|uniref:Uncharacterized protein n=1 Tax=Neospora caninum (strain Liverpool) TaxID=572307 RepID=F0VP49_NEOCL|nr:conserved hypothetical protein [Neospora caninum Liverpool]CBZ55495.1 conserved hypothetical protein [Neospora caninum Liverpool]CEL70234.1 TPA: hypothetical protein BN1204_059200 [Neospora caninum Liverpool]|eukprot:XP_003885523.1 conserved hypothetical protein [Neospora caninum Liverpool]